ncbi:hypothetical protein JCM15831A_15530 [Asaia astilbis]
MGYPKIRKHGCGNIAREGPLGLCMTILSTQADVVSAQKRCQSADEREGRGDYNLAFSHNRGNCAGNPGGKIIPLFVQPMHFPVAYDHLAHRALSIPGDQPA